MIKYRNKIRPRFPLLVVGLVAFGLAMIITTADLYGMDHFDSSKPASVSGASRSNSSSSPYADYRIANASAGSDYPRESASASSAYFKATPEPATIALLGVGLGALAVRRKKL